jgi:hypothetical protein
MSQTGGSLVLEVDRSKPAEGFRLVEEPLPDRGPGAVLLAVECFSLSANNYGYIQAADALRTWDAFPSATPGYGRVPVWGVARVIAADPCVATVGTRVSGFLPMATHVGVHVVSTPTGLLASDEPRAGMLPVYRRLSVADADADPGIDTVLLPVYPFAALLADDLRNAGARNVLVSSASSRSAAALSRLLSGHGVEVTGLTSARHRHAVHSMGVYAQVVGYDELHRIRHRHSTVYVDVAGSAEVTGAVHRLLGSRLAASFAVGATHVRSPAAPQRPGPAVTWFNTGEREVRFVGEHGPTALQTLYAHARRQLLDWASAWLRIRTLEGLAAAEPVWHDILAGRSEPLAAVVIRPSGA